MPDSTEDIKILLDDIVELFDRTNPIGNKAKRKVAFEPIASRIKHLDLLVSQKIPYMRENVGRIRWHYGAAFGVDVTNGHSYEQHMEWANRAISAIKRELNKS